MRYVISLLFSGSVNFLQKFTDRTGLKVDGESAQPCESVISLLFSGSAYFLQKFTDRTGLMVDGASIAKPSCIPSYNLLHNFCNSLQNFTLSSILLLPTLNLSKIY